MVKKNKRQLDLLSLVQLTYSFFRITPTIDKEPSEPLQYVAIFCVAILNYKDVSDKQTK